MYAMPNEFQAAGTHTDLIKTPAYAKVRNSLKKKIPKTKSVDNNDTRAVKNIHRRG